MNNITGSSRMVAYGCCATGARRAAYRAMSRVSGRTIANGETIKGIDSTAGFVALTDDSHALYQCE